MKNSKIEWTNHTFNPWIGCTKVSPGCANCYAAARDKRHLVEKVDHWGKGAPRHRTSEQYWRQPLKWNKDANRESHSHRVNPHQARFEDMPWHRPRVFCASLADWLDDEVPIAWLTDLLKLIYDTPHLDWLLLTKRPENWQHRIGAAYIHAVRNGPGCDADFRLWLHAWESTGDALRIPHNIWIGTTVEDQQRADERIPALLKIPARVRFLSCEPLLGPIDLTFHLSHIDRRECGLADDPLAAALLQQACDEGRGSAPRMIEWVICGGESGPGARPMHPDWARALRDQCKAADPAGTPFFFKQWGDWVPWEWDEQQFNDVIYSQHGKELWNDDAPRDLLNLPKGWDTFDISQTCDLCERVGKKNAGRKLDGMEWNKVPS